MFLCVSVCCFFSFFSFDLKMYPSQQSNKVNLFTRHKMKKKENVNGQQNYDNNNKNVTPRGMVGN